jgi:hypothetical protein
MARQQTQGTCSLCKGTFGKRAMTRHLSRCLEAHAGDEQASKGKKGRLLHLVVESPGDPRYWLHLEMPAAGKLQALDGFLRDIWLECCGHLSAFKIEGQKRHSPMRVLSELRNFLASGTDEWADPNELDMGSRVGDVFEMGPKLSYEYDFGSTTALSLKMVGEREGPVKKAGEVSLLARNDPPNILCGMCEKAPATIIDMENAYDESGWLCDACAEKDDLVDSDMTLPVVNSPRTGVCGYTGS